MRRAVIYRIKRENSEDAERLVKRLEVVSVWLADRYGISPNQTTVDFGSVGDGLANDIIRAKIVF